MGRLAASIILLTGWRRTLVAFAAGALAVLGQAPFDFMAACFIAFPVLVWLLDGAASTAERGLWARLKPSFATGYWFGFGYFLAGLWWIGGALLVEADSFAWALPFAVIGIPLVLAIFYGLAAALARLIWSDGIGKIAALAVSFGVVEWLRSFVLTGFPWNTIGYAAMPTPLLMQSVELVGLFGMSVLAVFVFSAPALLAAGRRSVTALALAIAIAAGHIGYGAYVLSQPSADAEEMLVARIVQPNTDLSQKWDKAAKQATLKSMLDLSAQASADGKPQPQLIIWPETSVPYVFSENPAALAAIGEMLKDGQTLIAGATRDEGEGNARRYYNSVVQIDDSGQIVDAVDKVHLVPFGEYIPFAELLRRVGLKQVVAGPMNFVAGSERHTLKVGAALMLPFVCYEIIFPALMPARDASENLLINVTNDAWFGGTPGPYQHLRQAQIRAVEVRRPVLRAANTGISAVIDPRGRITDGLPMDDGGVIDASVSLTTPLQAYRWLDRDTSQLAILIAFGLLAVAAKLVRSTRIN